MTLGPVSERVPFLELTVPEHPAVAQWRPLTEADTDAILATQQQSDQVDHPSWTTPRDDLAEFFELDNLDPAVDSLGAFATDGTVLAFGFVQRSAAADTRVQVHIPGTVAPAAREQGIGAVLLRWQTERAEQVLSGIDETLPAWIMNYQEEMNERARRLVVRGGYVEERWFTSMNRVLADEIADVPLPDGYRIVPYNRDLEQATLDARNNAFRDHWGSQPSVPQRWQFFVRSQYFRDDLSAVVLDEAGDVVAFTLSNVIEDDWETQGYSSAYIALIGVVREHRGKKLAPAVITTVLRAARDAGLERVDLDVDSASPTGANRLYENLGFVTASREVAFVRAH